MYERRVQVSCDTLTAALYSYSAQEVPGWKRRRSWERVADGRMKELSNVSAYDAYSVLNRYLDSKDGIRSSIPEQLV